MSIKRWSSLLCALALMLALAPAAAMANNGKKPADPGKTHACMILTAKALQAPGLLTAAAAVCGEAEEPDPGVDCDDPSTWPDPEEIPLECFFG